MYIKYPYGLTKCLWHTVLTQRRQTVAPSSDKDNSDETELQVVVTNPPGEREERTQADDYKGSPVFRDERTTHY